MSNVPQGQCNALEVVFVWKDFDLLLGKRENKNSSHLENVLNVSCKVIYKPLCNSHLNA